MTFDDLVNLPTPFAFYGVFGTKFKLGDSVFEAIEDPYDGYRSYLDTLEIASKGNAVFSRTPIASVFIMLVDRESTQGYELIDAKTGHIWLRVGTDDYGDYYPCFIFQYEPMAPTDETSTGCPQNDYPEIFI